VRAERSGGETVRPEHWLYTLPLRLRSLFHRQAADQELDEELGYHLEQKTQQFIAQGRAPQEAHRAALLELGGLEKRKEECRDARRIIWLQDLLQDIHYGLRILRKSPGFTTVAILTLALGIGANAAIFSILDPLLLQKLPVQNPDELVWVSSTGTLGRPAEGSAVETYYAYRDESSAFASVLAFSGIAPYDVTYDCRKISANGELVSANYFAALGVRPFAGRLLADSDQHGPPALVVSFAFWKRELNSNREAIGKVVTFGDQSDATHTGSVPQHSFTVVGIAPPEFFGARVGASPDFYVPLNSTDLPTQDYWQTQWVTIFARLKPGISVTQAQTSLNPLLHEVEKTSTLPQIERAEDFANVLITPASRGLSDARAQFSLPVRILMIVVGLLLLIACGNVANLLLARGMARKREFTVRLALGAGRWRVIRQLLTESTLLAVAGALAGVAVGHWTSHLLLASLSTRQLPVVLSTALNVRTLLFTAAVLALTVVVCGLAPALAAMPGELSEELKVQGSGSHRSSAQSRMSNALIVAQVALSMMLLAAAGLLLHSLFNLETFDAGFDRDKVLLVTMSGYSASRSRDQIAQFYVQLLDRVRQLPVVRSASYSSFTPVSGKEVGINVVVEGYTLRPGEVANERFVGVSPEYFLTMGIPLLAGRDFTLQDVHLDSPSNLATTAAIINQTMARRFFGNVSPLGRHFYFVEGNRPPLEIVGVVADSKYNDLREGPTDFFYIPGTHGDIEIRTDGSAKNLAGSLPAILHSFDSSITITGIRTLREQVDESLHSDRLIAALCATFSILALVLTCIGLYGALAYNIARRTSEIGIRMALGANQRDIFRLVVGQGLRLTIAGLILGIVVALGTGSLLGSMLFAVKQTDPLTFLGVSIALLCAAVLACYIPARRAMRVDPMIALRYE
jgi:macrolide transport system ATP-binding/permease protein